MDVNILNALGAFAILLCGGYALFKKDKIALLFAIILTVLILLMNMAW